MTIAYTLQAAPHEMGRALPGGGKGSPQLKAQMWFGDSACQATMYVVVERVGAGRT